MARNRKNESSELRPGAVLKAAFLCSLIVLVCVGYVWQKQQINQLGDQIRAAEKRRDRLHAQNDKLRNTIAELLSPAALDLRVQELRLGLVPPQQSQIWRLPEPRIAQPAPSQTGLMAARRSDGAGNGLR